MRRALPVCGVWGVHSRKPGIKIAPAVSKRPF